jgi:hypothetical protein
MGRLCTSSDIGGGGGGQNMHRSALSVENWGRRIWLRGFEMDGTASCPTAGCGVSRACGAILVVVLVVSLVYMGY